MPKFMAFLKLLLYLERFSGEFRIEELYFVPDCLSKTEISSGLGICCKMLFMTSSSMLGPGLLAESRLLRNACSSGFFPDPQAVNIATISPTAKILITIDLYLQN